MSDPVKVSIVIPCFNAEPWVARAIESALNQTWRHKEVVVLDDGSTDRSLEVIRAFEPRVAVATQSNAGQNASRNHLTRLSDGEWLVYLDADDELAPDSVEQKMAVADGADAIYGTIEVATFNGGRKTRYTVWTTPDFDDPLSAAFLWGFPNTSAFAFRRGAIVEVGGWDTAISNCTDYDMYFKLLMAGKTLRAAPRSMSLYRQWSMSQAVYQNPLRKARTRLEMMWRVAVELQSTGRLTAERQTAFERAAFDMIREIGRLNVDEAFAEHQRLRKWNSRFVPRFVSRSFGATYRLGGFRTAVRVANLARALNPIKRPPPGTDPESGLPYV